MHRMHARTKTYSPLFPFVNTLRLPEESGETHLLTTTQFSQYYIRNWVVLVGERIRATSMCEVMK